MSACSSPRLPRRKLLQILATILLWCNLSGGNNPQQSIRIETNLFKDGQQCFAGTAQMRKRVRRDEHKERFDS